jgi:hypothetical protein
MAPTKKELEAQLEKLGERHDALAEDVHRLATHTAVLGLAVRNPQAVPPADLDAAVTGIEEIARILLRRRT